MIDCKKKKISVIADLHIHSRYSRATSKNMNLDNLTKFAVLKGLNLMGTGDFTHPKWFEEIQSGLMQSGDSGLYIPKAMQEPYLKYMITSEVSTVFNFQNRIRKIHHLILTPSLEVAEQINGRLSRYCDLSLDGRPSLSIDAPELVEEIMEVSRHNMVIPAHIWTPWFSLFGAFSGFDDIHDCYQDMTKHIHALETGLSSNPLMNWRLSKLDKYTLVSNSDSHSHWPWRIGREANIFNVEELTYGKIIESITDKDSGRLVSTIETDPAYGKYHWTGHRKCSVSLSAEDAIKRSSMYPICRKPLTKGVEQRIEELADRESGFILDKAPRFMHLLPLSEIIRSVLGVSYQGLGSVWNNYYVLTSRFGNEYNVLIDAPKNEIRKLVDPKIAEAIIDVREDNVKLQPGYDGVYGKISLFDETEKLGKTRNNLNSIRQKTLGDYM